jgi:hypothetical protein
MVTWHYIAKPALETRSPVLLLIITTAWEEKRKPQDTIWDCHANNPLFYVLSHGIAPSCNAIKDIPANENPSLQLCNCGKISLRS